MLANLYLHPDAFCYNKVDTEEQVTNKLRCLIRDMRDVIYCCHEDNVFQVTSSLCETQVFEKQELIDFVQKHLTGEEIGVFFSMIGNKSTEMTPLTVDEIKEKCQACYSNSETNAIVILNNILENNETEDEKQKHKGVVNDYITFDTYQVVYDKSSWITLRRQILGNHPGTPAEFIGDCTKYFSNITFHENCINTLTDDNYDYLKVCPRRIVYYLSCLNDKFKNILIKYKLGEVNPNVILEDFSGTYGLDEPASIQMNYKKKDALTFSFCVKATAETLKVLCEPHLKISKADSNYRGSRVGSDFHPRIYFNFDKGMSDGHYYVGIIGKHVE